MPTIPAILVSFEPLNHVLPTYHCFTVSVFSKVNTSGSLAMDRFGKVLVGRAKLNNMCDDNFFICCCWVPYHITYAISPKNDM